MMPRGADPPLAAIGRATSTSIYHEHFDDRAKPADHSQPDHGPKEDH